MNMRFEEIKNMKDSALALKEMHALHFQIITLPGTFFFLLKAILFSILGYFILKQEQWPPNNIPLPFKTKIVKGSKSKAYALSYFVAAALSLITIAILWWGWLIII
jgi:polyferredoxin